VTGFTFVRSKYSFSLTFSQNEKKNVEQHEYSLLSFMERLKRPKKAILSKTDVKQRIQGYLSYHHKESNDEETIKMCIKMMEQMGFAIGLDNRQSVAYGYEEALLFPSLRPIGRFRWTHLKGENLEFVKTLGRRIQHEKIQFVHSSWFFHLQVKLLKIFHEKIKRVPYLYSNSLLFNLKDHSDVLLMISDPPKHLDIIIRGPSPFCCGKKSRK